MDNDIQLRFEDGTIRTVTSLKEAFAVAQRSPDLWKISFPFGTERVRLVRGEDSLGGRFYYEPMELLGWSIKE